ncbi:MULTISPECIES: substrate-binding periplasmic protein [Pseudomonas]|uniref:substrate-binding periplasmic protein n=1 Tax=Pseudomonas TaxID=286 RepID=UPI0005FCDC3F|nr:MULTISPECIES: transporter substrate-binding domain-containing protein [Pseudomonas]RXU59435.1 amino acid ABC transporter substrate-binding protein [Pseudomonas protegens]BAQ73861.1 periplasmic binding protein PedG [Pseudomonas sp. Os17]BAQ80150.1 periplasmic binding protein PedG [Pseudomonas sp. St29]
MGRLALFLSGLLLCCAAAQAGVRNYDTMIASGELKVAVYQDFAPYSFEDQGQPRGVDVELAQALAETLGVRLQLIWAPPGEKLDDDLRDYIWRGSPLRHQQLADLMMRVPYDHDYAQKRNELGELANDHVVMFGPYQEERWQVAFDRRRLDSVASVAVFQEHPIGVEVDSVPSFYLTSVFNGMLSAKTHHYPSVQQAFGALRAGQVDAVMAMRGEIDWQLHQAADPQLALAENAYPNMGKQVWEIGMAVHESNRQLAYAVEEALEGLIRDGRLQALYARYGLRYEVPEMYQ